MGREQRIGLAKGVGAVTGPAIIFGGIDHRGAYGIELDIAVAGEQIALFLDGVRLETAFLQGSGALVAVVDVGYEPSAECL